MLQCPTVMFAANPDRIFSPPATPHNASCGANKVTVSVDNHNLSQSSPLATPPSSFILDERRVPSRAKKVFAFHAERKQAMPCLATAAENHPMYTHRVILPLPHTSSSRNKQTSALPQESLPPKKRTTYRKVCPTPGCPPDTEDAFAFLMTPQAIQAQTRRSLQEQTTITAAAKRKRTDSQSSTTSSSSTTAAPSSHKQQSDRHIKKARTDAAMAYDKLDLSVADTLVYDHNWIPNKDALNHKVKVNWKGGPMKGFESMPYYDILDSRETYIPFTLRLTPEQYLKCKRSLILGAQQASKEHKPFRKSDAQKLCRIDVNKVSELWNVFSKLGWFSPKNVD